jgi:hypothetical protein
MSWFKTGYSETETLSKQQFETKGPKRIWIPPQATMRGMFLDEDPVSFFEHGFKQGGKWGNFEPCHKKNRGLASLSGGACPICESGEKMWPHLIGLHSFMNMTPWFTKKENREMNYRRDIFASKLGSDKKPGILKKLERLKQQHGRLKGIVFDIFRSGSQTESCGDDFTMVEKVDPKDIQDYGRKLVAEYVKRFNEKLPAKDHLTVEMHLKRHPWEPFNFEKLMSEGGDMAPRSISELRTLFTTGGASGGDDDDFGGDRSKGSDSSKSDDSDESPY